MASVEVLAEIEAVRDKVESWFAVDRSGWSPAEHSAVLQALLGLRERTDATVLEAVAQWDRVGAWSAEGALSAASWLRGKGSLAESDARVAARSARLVERNGDVAKLLGTAEITAGHVHALARHVTPPRAEVFDQHADALLDGARMLDVDDTAAMARRWATYADDLLDRGEPEDLHGRRGVWFRQMGDLTECHITGTVDDIAVLRTALDRLEPPDPASAPGGPRTLAQRRYDALANLAAIGHQDGEGRIDPEHTVNIVIDASTLTGGFDPDGRSEIPGAGSILPSTVQRLLCGSWISRVVPGPSGEPLDLGRRARLFSPAQKRAIKIRDGGCALGCCDRPPGWCDVHHIDPFGPPTNGETNLANGITLCRSHHTLVHRGWKLRQDEDGTWYLEPP